MNIFSKKIENKYNIVFRLGHKRIATEILNRTTIILGYIYVYPKLQNQGLGTKALQDFISWGDKMGYNLILEPGINSEVDLISFYSKFGFELLNKERKKELFKDKTEEIIERMIRLYKN